MDEFSIRDVLTEADIDVMHRYLADSYWAKGIPREIVAKSVKNSLPFGIFEVNTDRLVGFARVITDRATFAYLADVFVIPEFRGRGLSKLLMTTILDHPDLQGLRRFMLMTRDAHGLYAQFGFTPVTDPAPIMQRHRTNVYLRPSESTSDHKN